MSFIICHIYVHIYLNNYKPSLFVVGNLERNLICNFLVDHNSVDVSSCTCGCKLITYSLLCFVEFWLSGVLIWKFFRNSEHYSTAQLRSREGHSDQIHICHGRHQCKLHPVWFPNALFKQDTVWLCSPLGSGHWLAESWNAQQNRWSFQNFKCVIVLLAGREFQICTWRIDCQRGKHMCLLKK